NQFVPHKSRIAQTMIQGSSDIYTSPVVGFLADPFGAGRSFAESSLVRSAGEVQTSFGCQICRKPIRQAIAIREAPISTIHGLMKFGIRNCGTANETPVTRIAGQI